LSDGVFAFAVTLLVVSLEVPKTFNELMETMRGFGAFAISFTLLFMVGLINTNFPALWPAGCPDRLFERILLFVVLFYVYPLKFLFTLLVAFLLEARATCVWQAAVEGMMVDSAKQVSILMIIFGAGYIAVFGVFVLLYFHAYRKRFELDLTSWRYSTPAKIFRRLC